MDGHFLVITGMVTSDPEMRYTNTGKAVTNFRVSSVSIFNGRSRETHFKVTGWEEMAERMVATVSKDDSVGIKGRLNSHGGHPKVWQNKDGKHMASYEVTCTELKVFEKEVPF